MGRSRFVSGAAVAEEPGVAEGLDDAVVLGDPVAAPVGGCRDPHGPPEELGRGLAEEPGVAEGEHGRTGSLTLVTSQYPGLSLRTSDSGLPDQTGETGNRHAC
jgi:hypothetical protein